MLKALLNNHIDPQTYNFSTGSANRYEERDELRKNIEEAFNIKCVEKVVNVLMVVSALLQVVIQAHTLHWYWIYAKI